MSGFTPAKRRAITAIPVAVLLFVGVLALIAYARMMETRRLEAHARAVLQASRQVLIDLSDAEAGQRGYLLTGRAEFLEPYRTAVLALHRDTADLRRLTEANPGQRARLAELRSTIEQKLAEQAQTIVLRRRSGAAAALALVESDRGRALMERARAQLAVLQREDARLLEQRIGAEARRARIFLLVVVLGILLTTGSIILTSTLLARYAEAQARALARIAQQNEELSAQAEALAEGAAELQRLNEELLGRTRAAEEARAEVEAEHRRMVLLHDFTVALSGARTPADVTRVAGEWGRGVLGADVALVTVLADDGRWLEPVHVSGSANPPAGRWPRIPLDAPAVVAEAVRQAELIHAESAAGETLYPDPGLPRGLEAALAAPLRFEGRTMGAWACYYFGPRIFRADEVQLFGAVTEFCAQALERTRLFEAERRAREEAEQANAAKVKFMRVMSHDLRTPLNAILGYTEILHGGYLGQLEEKQREFLERILASTGVLRSLIEEVLEYARIEAGRLEIRPADIPVQPLLERVELIVAPQAETKGVALVREPVPPLQVHGDEDRIGQILSNLVTNAVKYTPRGGEVIVTARPEDGQIAFRVADTGPGIAPENLDRIFEPFVQLDRPGGDDSPGVGLGLAISRELARAMGGDLRAESEPGRGTTFTLRLPRAPSSGQAQPRLVAV